MLRDIFIERFQSYLRLILTLWWSSMAKCAYCFQSYLRLILTWHTVLQGHRVVHFQSYLRLILTFSAWVWIYSDNGSFNPTLGLF